MTKPRNLRSKRKRPNPAANGGLPGKWISADAFVYDLKKVETDKAEGFAFDLLRIMFKHGLINLRAIEAFINPKGVK